MGGAARRGNETDGFGPGRKWPPALCLKRALCRQLGNKTGAGETTRSRDVRAPELVGNEFRLYQKGCG